MKQNYVFWIALALAGALALTVLVTSGEPQTAPDRLPLGDWSVPLYQPAYSIDYLDGSTLAYTTPLGTLPHTLGPFYLSRLGESGWRRLPGEHYQREWSGRWQNLPDDDYASMHGQLVIFERASGGTEYLLVALHPTARMCGSNNTTVVIRVSQARSATERAAEGQTLFAMVDPRQLLETVPTPRPGCDEGGADRARRGEVQ